MEQVDNIFLKYVEIGECVVDVPKVVKQWDANWFLSQWHEQYRLVYGVNDTENCSISAVITKACAGQLIVELDLVPTQSPIFRNGKTWRKA